MRGLLELPPREEVSRLVVVGVSEFGASMSFSLGRIAVRSSVALLVWFSVNVQRNWEVVRKCNKILKDI